MKMKCIGKAKFKYVKYNYVDNFRPKVRIKWLEKIEEYNIKIESLNNLL